MRISETERWDDEPPRAIVKADDYGHVPPCRSFKECLEKRLHEARTA